MRYHREFGTPLAEVQEMLRTLTAFWLAKDKGEELYDIDEFIAANRAEIEPVIQDALRHWGLGASK